MFLKSLLDSICIIYKQTNTSIFGIARKLHQNYNIKIYRSNVRIWGRSKETLAARGSTKLVLHSSKKIQHTFYFNNNKIVSGVTTSYRKKYYNLFNYFILFFLYVCVWVCVGTGPDNTWTFTLDKTISFSSSSFYTNL